MSNEQNFSTYNLMAGSPKRGCGPGYVRRVEEQKVGEGDVGEGRPARHITS